MADMGEADKRIGLWPPAPGRPWTQSNLQVGIRRFTGVLFAPGDKVRVQSSPKQRIVAANIMKAEFGEPPLWPQPWPLGSLDPGPWAPLALGSVPWPWAVGPLAIGPGPLALGPLGPGPLALGHLGPGPWFLGPWPSWPWSHGPGPRSQVST